MPATYGALSGILVVAVIAVAFGTQAPQLGMAEFAPVNRNAVQPPPTTGNDNAGGSNRAGSRRANTTTTVSPTASVDPTAPATGAPTTLVGRSRTCVGMPPRQTEDPMSPPCVATIFEGDNGGPTWAGVTATEVRVAIPISGGASDTNRGVMTALLEHFNRHYELYGRRLVPVLVPTSGNDAAGVRAAASNTASLGVFAATTGVAEWHNGSKVEPYLQELARRQVITIADGPGQWLSDRRLFDAYHPYLWSVTPSAEDYQRNLADFACNALADRPARHHPEEASRTTTRKFGIINHGTWSAPSIRTLVDGLAACGQEVAVASVVGCCDYRTAMNTLKAAGATTVVCICNENIPEYVVRSGWGDGFRPEWLFAPVVSPDDEYEWVVGSSPTQGKVSIFGLLDQPKIVHWQAEPGIQAVLETAPTALKVFGDMQVMFLTRKIYSQLLVLAAGIQGAGPVLTPETFAAALMSTQFPNPGAGQAPSWQPSAGFGPGDHSFYDDYVVAWWGNNETPLRVTSFQRAGSFCYLDRGARHSVGGYPADADGRLFTGSCR